MPNPWASRCTPSSLPSIPPAFPATLSSPSPEVGMRSKLKTPANCAPLLPVIEWLIRACLNWRYREKRRHNFSIELWRRKMWQMEDYSKVARDKKAAFFAAWHVKSKFLIWRKSEELSRETKHLWNEMRINAMINHLEDPPLLTRLHNFLANVQPTAIGFIDTGERYHGNGVAEMVVCYLGTLLLVEDETGMKPGLSLRRERLYSCWLHWCLLELRE